MSEYHGDEDEIQAELRELLEQKKEYESDYDYDNRD